MYDNDIKEINNLVKKIFNERKREFQPGLTKISMASPPYGHEEVIEAIDSMLSSWVTMGKKVKEFEVQFAKYIGVKHAIMVNSGSSANLIALAILTNPKLDKRFSPGDEIITPALTWPTTVYPIINNNLKPVFVDVELSSYNIDVNKIENAITDKTKAIMLVHILGNPVNMEQINQIAKKHNLVVIEDSCEAHGAEFDNKKIGSFGDLSTFSFFVSHHITTMEGGMILTNNDDFFELGKALRAFGWIRDLKDKDKFASNNPDIDPRFLFVNLGFNLRPLEIQGAFGIHQIKKLDRFLELRRDNAKFWNEKFGKYQEWISLPIEEKKAKHAFFGYPILIKDNAPFSRKQLMDYLFAKNIEVRPIMSGNLLEHPSAKLFNYRVSGDTINASKIMRDGIFIPNHQDVQVQEREYIANCLSEFIDDRKWESN